MVADRKTAQNTNREVALRITGFFCSRRHGVKADIRKEDDRGALVDADEAVRREWRVVRRIDVHQTDTHEQCQREQLDDDHHVVGGGALARPSQQQPRHEHHDCKSRHVHEQRDTRDARSRVDQRLNVRVRAQEGRAVTGIQPGGQINANTSRQRGEVVARGNRHRNVSDGVFENEIPSDDPGNDLTESGIRVRVGAARLRNHRGELRIAQCGQRTRAAKQQERKNQSRTGAVSNDFAARPV